MRRLIAARDPETGRAMDDEQLVDNLLTFYLAGHETTAKALTWTLYLLSRSPEWSARARGGDRPRDRRRRRFAASTSSSSCSCSR